MQISSVQETLKTHSAIQEQHSSKLKETNDIVYKLDNVQMPSINTRLSQMVTKDDLAALKRENEEQVNINYRSVNFKMHQNYLLEV